MADTRVSIPRLRPGSVRLKARPEGPLLVPMGPGQAIWTPRRYDRFSQEGFIYNAIVYRCVRLVAEGVASLAYWLRSGDDIVDQHPLLDLLAKPNPMQPQVQFLEALVAFTLLAGNSYLFAGRPGRSSPPRELWLLRPDRMRVIPSADGMPAGYEYEANGRKVTFEVDPVTGQGEVLHFREFHPIDDWYGLSPVEPAARNIDQDNAAAEHNASLLQNGARPSGAFIFENNLGSEDRKRAEAVLRNWYTGATAAGLPVVLGGGWSFTEMSITPKDLDFIPGMEHNARRICAAFNVPHVLVVPGDSTYNNRVQAREELYEHSIIPQTRKLLASLNGWLVPMFGGGRADRSNRRPVDLALDFDADQIPALAGKREVIRAGARSDWRDGLITHGEAREALGYPPDPAKEGQYRTDTLGLGMPGGPGASPEGEDGASGSDGPATRAARSAGSGKATSGSAGLITKAMGDDLAGAFDDEGMIDLMLPIVRDTVHSFGQFELDRLQLGIRFDIFDPKVVEFLERWGAERVTGFVTQTTKRAIGMTIAEAVEAGETQFQMVKRIQEVFADASGRRARLIAQTETVRSSNFGALEAIAQSGLTHKRWLSTRDERTRGNNPKDKADHVGMDLQIKGVAENFVDPRNGHAYAHPGASEFAEDVCNCRCVCAAHDPDEEQMSAGELETKAAMVWKQREGQRLPFEQHLEGACIHGFALQLEAVLRRFREIIR